jgi:general L-amino acid transport system substrate-binding protein
MSKRLVACVACALLLAPPNAFAVTDAPPPPAAATAGPSTPPTGIGATLAAVKKRGRLRCGSSAALAGFGQIDSKGQWSGFDVDFCRAVATAIFGEPDRVEFVPLTAHERFDALHRGTVDLLSRDTTWTLSREAAHSLLFAGVSYYDGQGFLVRRSLGAKTAYDLSSGSVCVQQDTTTELNLTDFFRQRGLKYEAKVFPTDEETQAAYRSGKCAAYTSDASALSVVRASLPDPDNNVLLPQIISKEPLGPAVRQGDDQWFLIVRWTLMAMIDAEELGVTQKNVDELARGDNPLIRRLLGIDGNYGQGLGLTVDWAYRVVKFVGNYGEMFQRNLGDGSPLKIKRGYNELWTRGGLMYAAPIQ